MQLETEQSKESDSSPSKAKSLSTRRSRRQDSFISAADQLSNGSNDTQKKNEFGDQNNIRQITDFESWRTLEKDLFKEGLNMFGRNRLVHGFALVQEGSGISYFLHALCLLQNILVMLDLLSFVKLFNS